jgi:exodeoxyribonuclease VII small subunit
MSVMGNEPRTFAEVNERLAEIVEEVRDKDLPLEKSLDLYEEAVRLSNSALAFVHKPDLSPEEAGMLAEVRAKRGDDAADGESAESEPTEAAEDAEELASDDGTSSEAAATATDEDEAVMETADDADTAGV